MVPKMKTMGIANAKAQFLSLATDIASTRQPLLITKNGKPLVRVIPCDPDADPLAKYRFGGGRIVGDIESPASELDDWEYD
jgi:prevent-host-death family protein